YPRTPPSLLRPGARLPQLTGRVAALGADVACLQEVEEDVFAALTVGLGQHAGCFEKKAAGRPDGCATFVHRDVPLVARTALRYTDGTGHVALLAALSFDTRLIGVANTHARWDAPGTPIGAQVGRRQMLDLLDAVERFEPRCDGWVLCGDLNATPDSA